MRDMIIASIRLNDEGEPNFLLNSPNPICSPCSMDNNTRILLFGEDRLGNEKTIGGLSLTSDRNL